MEKLTELLDRDQIKTEYEFQVDKKLEQQLYKANAFRMEIYQELWEEAFNGMLKYLYEKAKGDFYITIDVHKMFCNIDIPKAKESLEKLRTMGLDIFGKLMPDEALFVKSFFLMESIEKDNTVILVMRLKLDVQEQFESAISPFLQILNFMFSPKVLSHVLVDFRVKNSFETIFKNNLKGLEAIKDYSFELKADLIRNKMISLLKSYYPLGRSHKIIEFLLNPSDISLEIKSAFGNLLINDDNRQKFNVPLSFLKTILSEMLLPKASMYFPLITAIDGVEFTINTQRVFANVKVNVPGLID